MVLLAAAVVPDFMAEVLTAALFMETKRCLLIWVQAVEVLLVSGVLLITNTVVPVAVVFK